MILNNLDNNFFNLRRNIRTHKLPVVILNFKFYAACS